MMISKKEFYTQGNTCPVRVVLYDNPDVVPKACILYFHGGGLLYGHSDDLPRTHTWSGSLAPDTRWPHLSTRLLRPQICV